MTVIDLEAMDLPFSHKAEAVDTSIFPARSVPAGFTHADVMTWLKEHDQEARDVSQVEIVSRPGAEMYLRIHVYYRTPEGKLFIASDREVATEIRIVPLWHMPGEAHGEAQIGFPGLIPWLMPYSTYPQVEGKKWVPRVISLTSAGRSFELMEWRVDGKHVGKQLTRISWAES